MRIAVDARILCLSEIRGIGSYLANLLRVWPVPDDEFLLLIEDGTIHDNIMCPARLTIRQISAPPGNRLHIWEWWSLPRVVQVENIDLLWSPANVSFPFTTIPQVVTIHDTLLQEKVQFEQRLDNFYYTKLQPWLTRRYVKGVITVSRFSQQRISAVFGCDSDRIRVIYNGTSFSGAPFANKFEAASYLQSQGVVEGPFVYLLGAESAWKNTDAAVRAFRMVLDAVPGITCVVSGIQERVMPRFTALCRDLGVGKYIKLLGFVDPVTRDALYQGAELFVYPTLFEGFGLPPLEAMALGTPVVASCAASIPEVVGDAALLVDAENESELASAIIKLLESPALCGTLRNRGRDNYRRFDWTTAARQHRQYFTEM